MMTRSRDAISRPSFLVGSVRVDVERDKCRALSRSSAIYRSTHAHACLCITRCSICPHTYVRERQASRKLTRERVHARTCMATLRALWTVASPPFSAIRFDSCTGLAQWHEHPSEDNGES
jgi:hypothetical protein